MAQLERAAGFGREDPPEARLAKLEALLSPAPAEDIALVAELLSVPGGERYPPPDLAPQRKRARTFAALLQQLEAPGAPRAGRCRSSRTRTGWTRARASCST